MKVLYPYLKEYRMSQRSIKRCWPEAEWKYTTPGDPWIYPDFVAEHWNKGEDLLIVEGDIVAGPMDYQLMESCPGGWCTGPYPLGTARTMFPFGYGFTKFSRGFQAGLPYEAIQMHHRDVVEGHVYCPPCARLKHTCKDCLTRMCHYHQDTYMWHTLMILFGEEVRPHIHRAVDHQHFGNRQLVSFGKGEMVWKAPDPHHLVN